MDNSDNHRSTDIPIRVSIASELESTNGDGVYTPTADGFVLSFSAGDAGYKIEHSEKRTILSATGLIGYDIELCAAPTRTELVSPFGTLQYGVRTDKVCITHTDGGIRIGLKFTLFSEGAEDIVRDLTVDARFCS